MSKKCDNCGMENSEDAMYCNNCGVKLNSAPNSTNNKNKNEKKSSIKNMIIALIIFLTVVFIIYNIYSDQEYMDFAKNITANKLINEVMQEYNIHSTYDAAVIIAVDNMKQPLDHKSDKSILKFIVSDTVNNLKRFENTTSAYDNDTIDVEKKLIEYRQEYIDGNIGISDYINKVNNIIDKYPELENYYESLRELGYYRTLIY